MSLENIIDAAKSISNIISGSTELVKSSQTFDITIPKKLKHMWLLNKVEKDVHFLFDEDHQRAKAINYIFFSLGGEENIAEIKMKNDSWKVIFFNFEKVKYMNLKNYYKVFVSEKLGSVILVNKPNGTDVLKNIIDTATLPISK